MLQHQNVRFRKHVVNDAPPNVGGVEPPDIDGIEVCEIKLANGDVGVFPATDMLPDRGVTYAQMYAGRYQQFKNGEAQPMTDAERIDHLEGQVREKDELLAKHGIKPDEDEKSAGYPTEIDEQKQAVA
jgi:hypothetical protein